MAKKKNNKRRIAPKCKAFLLCQGIIIEAGTNNINIIRIFNGFLLPKFPGTLWPFTVFIQLVGGIGRYQAIIEIQDLHDGTVVSRSRPDGFVEFADRVSAQNLIIPVPPLPLKHAGPYDVVFLADGQEIDRQQFEVTQAEEPQNGDH